jgi:hypothetical protein
LKKSFEKFLYLKFFVYHSIVVSGKRAANIQNKKTNKIYKHKNEKEKRNNNRKSEKQKSFFIGNIFLNSGKSKNACLLWSN